MKILSSVFLLLLLLLSASHLPAQKSNVALEGIPPQIIPIIRNIEQKYTPADLMQMVQKATPTGWKIIQEKTKLTEAGQPQGFTMNDFERLPEKEQQALIAAIQPVIMNAVAQLTQQEQMQLLTMAKGFDPNTIITPVMGMVTKTEVKK
jgi:hypothetical protein